MMPIKYASVFVMFVMILSMQSSVFANDNDEQRYIESNRQKATEGTEQAMFKVYRITCLKSNAGKKALQACQQALAIDPDDVAIRHRKKALTQALKPPPKPAPKPQVVRPTPPPIPAPVVRQQPLAEVSNTNVVVEKEKDKQKTKKIPPKKPQQKVESDRKIVKQVQRQLKQLGFSIGVADGVAGKKTQQAIKRFQKLTNRPLNSKVTPSLLATLKKAHLQHKIANKLHVLATEQQKEGRLETSLKTVTKGLKKAPWHQPLKKLKVAVKQQVVALQKKASEQKSTENKVVLKEDKIEKIDDEQSKDKSKSKEKTEEKKEAVVTVQEKQLEVKKVVSEDKKLLVTTATMSVDQLKKQKELFASIEEKQKNIATINMNISMEQLVLLNDAQQSLEKLERDKSKP